MTSFLRRYGFAFVWTGAALWLLHVALFVGVGVRTGRAIYEAGLPEVSRVDGLLFMGVYLTLGLAVVAVRARLDRAAPRDARIAGAVGAGAVAALAGAAGVVGLVAFGAEAGGLGRIVGPVGILSLLLGSVLVGAASLRARTLPRGVAWALVAFGLATVPLAFALPTLAGPVPLYALEETHFLLGVAVWAWVGSVLRAPRPAATSVASAVA